MILVRLALIAFCLCGSMWFGINAADVVVQDKKSLWELAIYAATSVIFTAFGIGLLATA